MSGHNTNLLKQCLDLGVGEIASETLDQMSELCLRNSTDIELHGTAEFTDQLAVIQKSDTSAMLYIENQGGSADQLSQALSELIDGCEEA